MPAPSKRSRARQNPVLLAELAEFLSVRGADLVGVADLSSVPVEAREGMPRAVTFAVALKPKVLAGITEGPTKEYHGEYTRVNELLGQLSQQTAEWLQAKGFKAIPSAATEKELDKATLATALPHKTVALLAGFGWIGKSALLVTREFGSGIRLNRVLTDAPLPVAQPDMSSRCGDCQACVRACPGRAPTGLGWERGRRREEYYDAFQCRLTANRLAKKRTGIDATFCGICIVACPWTKQYLRRSGCREA